MPRTADKFTAKEKKEIGLRIKQARQEKGLKQEDLARMVGKSLGTVRAAEQGTTVPYSWIRELAGVFDKSSNWFWYGDATPPKTIDQKLDLILAELAELKKELGRLSPA